MMRQLWMPALLLIALTGCLHSETIGNRNPASNQSSSMKQAPAQVRADDINETNAHEMAKALSTEIDFDMRLTQSRQAETK